MNLKIREGTANDYIDIKNLYKEVHNLHVKNRPDVFLDVDNPLEKEWYEKLLNSGGKKIFVVEGTYNKELVAYSTVEIITQSNIQILVPSKFAYIDEFCVKSLYQRKGIGRLLFNHIEDYAKSEGASSIQLNVWEFNENAIKFYESMGMSTRSRRMELNL